MELVNEWVKEQMGKGTGEEACWSIPKDLYNERQMTERGKNKRRRNYGKFKNSRKDRGRRNEKRNRGNRGNRGRR